VEIRINVLQGPVMLWKVLALPTRFSKFRGFKNFISDGLGYLPIASESWRPVLKNARRQKGDRSVG